MSFLKGRAGHCLAAVLTASAGLTTLLFRGPLADFLGDSLWTVMVYLLGRILLPKISAPKMALAALVISFADELQQLCRAPWINGIRRTLPGRILLGSSFAWLDFVAYTVGALAGLGLEWGISRIGGEKRA